VESPFLAILIFCGFPARELEPSVRDHDEDDPDRVVVIKEMMTLTTDFVNQ
jgi:hypothetical protein